MDIFTFREALYNKSLESNSKEEKILNKFLENFDDNELKVLIDAIINIYNMFNIQTIFDNNNRNSLLS